MAGISNTPYRVLAQRYGAAMVYSEMVSSHGLFYNSKKTEVLLDFIPEERPIGIQLFGADPDIMEKACQIVSKRNPDIIDLNFGCPAKKVVRKNGGAAVLKDLGLTRALVEAAVAGSSIPVTVKIRSGWDELTKIYLEAGQVCQEAGASAVTLHARTRSKGFSGQADWTDIKRLKESLDIPVIGNGDVVTGPDAKRMLDETGCDAVMVGRAAMGNPWVFREITHYLETGEEHPGPTPKEKADVIYEHAVLLGEIMGEEHAMKHMRKHTAWYVKGMPGRAAIRKAVNSLTTLAGLRQMLKEYLG